MGVPKRNFRRRFILVNIVVALLVMVVGYLFICEIAIQMYVSYR